MKIKHFVDSLEKKGFDAFIITRDPNIFYFAGTISGGILLVTSNSETVLLVPSLNLAIAQDQVEGIEVKPFTKKRMMEKVTTFCSNLDPKKIGFDKISLDVYQELNKALKSTEIKSDPGLVWEMRKIKDTREQNIMKKAAELADIGMDAVREILQEGLREYEIAAEASYAMRREGAEDYAFPFIVASGIRSAYPHAGVTDRKLRKGDFVTVDMGAKYHEYCTDLTRTFIIGSPSKKQRALYETAKEANQNAFPMIKEDSKGVEVDKIARDIIDNKGYGENFIHGLGHGVGLEVHEPPTLSKTSEDTLREGNVVTNEPGIYIPGFGGVRIEDTVLVTSSGPLNLTRFDRDIDAIQV